MVQPFFKMRPATASSLAARMGSRLSGWCYHRHVQHGLDAQGARLALRPKLGRHRHDQAAGIFRILMHHLHHGLDSHMLMGFVPAIIIGHHRDDGVRQLGLARELGFRHRGHADHAAVPGAIEKAFRAGGELRPFHADIGAAFGMIDALFPRRQGQGAGQTRADRMRHGKMRDKAGTEKTLLPRKGAVDELVRHHEGAGRQFRAQRAAGRDRDHVGDAHPFQGIDIGAVIDAARGLDMAAAMARQKHHIHAMKGSRQQLIRRLPPRAFHRLPAGIFQPRNFIDSGPADDSKHGFSHEKGRSSLGKAPFYQ